MSGSNQPDAITPSTTPGAGVGFEPDREWKEQERQRIRRRLRNILNEAKLSYELRRGKEPNREVVFKAEYDKAILELGKVAMDDYQEAIRKERRRRQAEAMSSFQNHAAPAASGKSAIIMDPRECT
jgi:hypothetical protein